MPNCCVSAGIIKTYILNVNSILSLGSHEEENFDLIQPTLIQQVKKILDQYPDDGQILKELIQNAEDADASEIKFLFDQHSYGTTQLFRPGLAKFQGPALYAYNNAKFSDGDWRGIRMLCDSIKVKDPMKVGRFGLGFKSVFHLTDLPSVISDNRLLVIDPHEKFLNDETNKRTGKGWHLGKDAKSMSQIPEQFAPYKGIFNCSEESFRSGNYEGTLFRFPLRQEGSELSETLYSEEKIHGLFECFQTDASLVLLFLKSLENIELYERGADNAEPKKVFQVKIADECLQDVHCKRREFTEQVREARSASPEVVVPPVKVTYSVTIQTVRYPATGIELVSNHSFMVTHYFSGNDVSSELQSLITDESLSYMPWVGVAMPLTSENNDAVPNDATGKVASEPKGHLFCFLPLPLEKKSLTGLPVHVNGYFALSQNRRHLKWPSADQDESVQPLTDKALLWNKCLLQEVVPRAYAELILQAIDLSNPISTELSKGMLLNAIYSAWPNPNVVDPKWKATLRLLFEQLFSREVLHTEADGGKWLKLDDAIIDRLMYNDDTRKVVVDAMLRSNQYVVTVPIHVTSTIEGYYGKSIKSITPGLVRYILRSNPQCYANFSYNKKLLLLKFVLRETNFEDLCGLKLLPLSDKTFTNFSSTKGTAVYIPSPEHPQSLLPGLKDKFIDPQLDVFVVEQLNDAVASGKTQIRHLDKEAVASLLPDALPCEWSTTTKVTWYPGDSTKNHPSMEWFIEVWYYLILHYKEAGSLARFQGLPLIPVSLNTNPVQLERLKFPSSQILRIFKDSSLPDSVVRVRRVLGLTVLDDLPKCVSDHPEIIPCFFKPPSPQGVIHAIVEHIRNKKIQIMVPCGLVDDIRAFREFLSRIPLDPSLTAEEKKALRQLPLFETIKGSGKQASEIVSCDEVSEGIAADDLPPVPPLRKLVDLREQSSRMIAQIIGMKQLQNMYLLYDMLEDVREHKYSTSEVDKLMRYILERLPIYSNHEVLRDKLKTISFVPTSSGLRTTPRELFDPESSVLRQIFSEEEDSFPSSSSLYGEPSFLNDLRRLGLKGKDGITACNITQSAEMINSMENKEAAQVKSKAILDYLSCNPQLLNGNVGFQKLGQCLKVFSWVPVLNRKPDTYPKGLPLKNENQVHFERPERVKSQRFITLVGSINPIIGSHVGIQLASEFGWNLKPCLDDVLLHLKNVISSYDVSEKASFITVVKNVYQFLQEESSDRVTCGLEKWEVLKWVWNGDGFSYPSDVVLEKPWMDLSPYLCPLPAETRQYSGLFSRCGMKTECDVSSLLDVVSKIREKHEKTQTVQDVRRDLQLSIDILNTLTPKAGEVLAEHVEANMLITIDVDSDDTLKFAPIQDCTYCDLEWRKQGHDSSDVEEEEDAEIRFIHRNIPIQTAIDLGVPTLMSRMLEAEELDVGEGFGQYEPLTRRLNRLLEEYTDGFSVPKELIQNADDAGATEVRFLYDERTNDDAMTCLIDEGMKGCQGPALWTYNDAVFSENDFQNITKLNGATKEEDVGKIGRFGLGFNAVYNLTDVPSLVSGNNIVIFDPHTTYLGRGIRDKSKPGIKVDLTKNKRKLRKLANQFKPFNGIFGCDLRADSGQTSYNGTLFRFPLRTKDQAKRSEIKALHYDDEQVKELLRMLVSGAESLLLFTQNVCKVTIYHLPKGSSDTLQPVELFCITKSETRVIQELKVDITLSAPVEKLPAKEQAFIKQCSILKASSKVMKDEKSSVTGLLIKSSMVLRVHCNISDSGKEFLASDMIVKSTPGHWLVMSCMVGGDTLQLAKSSKSLIPTAGVAAKLKEVGMGTFIPMPIQKYIGEQVQPHDGRIFCFLPLPIHSGFPVNINGSFAIDANRRHLREKTEDDKSDFAAKWNNILMENAVCQAYLSLLEDVKSLLPSGDCVYEFHSLWPRTDNVEHNSASVAKQFYKALCVIPDESPPSLFSDGKVWSDLQHIVFLDPAVRKDKVIGPSALKAFQLLRRGMDVVVDIPEEIFRSFEKSGCTAAIQSHCFDKERVYREVFFPAIEADVIGDNHLRDELVLYALDDCTGELSSLVGNYRCIPVSPDGKMLKYPKELIHPHGKAAALFRAEDGKFPCGEQYVSEARLLKLVDLGMRTDDLEWDEIIERAESVKRLNSRNVPTAYEEAVARTRAIISFIGSKLEINNEVEEGISEKMQQIEFLPILMKPKKTTFKWKSDEYSSTTLLAAKVLYSEESKRLVGATTPLLSDHKYGSIILPPEVRNFLNMKKNDTLQQVKAQLETVIATDLDSKDKECFEEIKKVCEALYEYFHSKLENNESDIKEFLMPLKFILVERHFLSVSQVAFTCEGHLAPYLYELPIDYACKFLTLFRKVAVQDSFGIRDYVSTLQKVKSDYQEKKLDAKILDVTAKLAELLEKILSPEHSLDETIMTHGSIFLPDSNADMRRAHELSIKDCHWMPDKEGVKYVNDKIPLRICTGLGVNTRRQETLRKHAFGIPFGQSENLTTRLKRILTGYPCSGAILKELLQNADDAEASKICFIKDPRHHPEERVFEECWKPLQGPALCVYNNSPFTRRDIDGIQNLGEGSKGDDPNKSGQYGVGFNAVYHLTDAPSFISKGDEIGEFMCVFDPHCKFVPGSTKEEPGRGFEDLPQLRKIFTDIFPCYLDEHFPVDNATIFRFPLRNEDMAETSNISNTPMTIEKLDVLMGKFKEELFDVLLFVNNVTEISMCEVDEKTGGLKNQYKVKATLSSDDENRRKEFGAHVKEVGCNLHDGNISLENIPKKEVSYTVNLKDSQGSYQTWLVVQRIGFEDNVTIPECVTRAVEKKELGLLPRGGVASLVDSSTTNSVPAKAFCFLPLPFETGLPVHINGHFALDHEARRNLWRDESGGYRGSWNDVLLRLVVAPCYVTLLDKVRGFIKLPVDINQQTNINCDRNTAEGLIANYISLFPSLTDEEMYWKILTTAVYKHMDEKKACLLPVLRCMKMQERREKTKIQVERVMITWFSPTGEGDKKAFFDNLEQTTATRSDTTVNSSKMLAADSPSRTVVPEEKPKEVKLKEALLAVGFNLLEMPMEICKNFTDAGVDVSTVCPSNLVHFFGTYRKTGQLCRVGSLPLPLKNTPFKDDDKLLLVLKYCKKYDGFISNLKGLPFLLTQDEMLRVFDDQNPAFLTTHLEITPQSQSQFVHRSLYNRIFYRDGGPAESPVFKVFDISAFAKLLSSSLDASIFKTNNHYAPWIPNDVKCDKIPSCDWLWKVWKFFSREIEKEFIAFDAKVRKIRKFIPFTNRDFDRERRADEQNKSRLVREALSPVNHWCLLPATERSLAQDQTQNGFPPTRHILVPVAMAETVLSFDSSMFNNAFRKLFLPELNCKIIQGDTSLADYSKIARMIVANLGNPKSVVTSLSQKLQTSSLANGLTPLECLECERVLRYFSGNVGKLTEDDSVTLKKLPFYPTVHGDHISISGKKAFVLPLGVPENEMNIWEAESGIVFLEHRDALKDLYKFLDCASMNQVDVYCEVIFDKFQDMSAEARLAHLRFLCKILLVLKSPIYDKSVETSQEAEKLLAALNHLEFIPHKDGGLKRASSFYDPQNEVFRVMFRDEVERFPPEPFSEDEWLPFLRLVGLIHVVSADTFIEFAEEVELEASTSESGATKTKSDALVEHLFTRKNIATDTLLRDIRGIHFICRNKVPKYLRDLYPQYGTKQNGNLRYVCFEESLVPNDETVTWTTASSLPHVADPMHCWTFPKDYPDGHFLCSYPKYQKEVISKLGILAKPTMELVVSHCQNICRRMAKKNEEMTRKSVYEFCGEITIIQVCQVMSDIFQFLQSNLRLISSKFKDRLKSAQCVVVEGGGRFVFPNQIVIDLLNDQEIQPYLFRIPPAIAAYSEFFQHIGATNTVTATQYALVLERIYRECGNAKMDPNETKKSFKATKGLFEKVTEEKEARLSELSVLYLPGVRRSSSDSSCNQVFMRNSTELVCDDAPHFRERISGFKPLLLVRFQECELKVDSDDTLVNKLPELVRPQMLSNLVHEHLIESVKESVSCYSAAQELKQVLTSTEFCSGFFRLVKHEDYEAGRETDNNIFAVIRERLGCIKVYSVSNLCTQLVYQGDIIPRSEAEVSCFEERNEGTGQQTWNIYIKEHEELAYFVSRVAEVVNRITGCLLTNTLVHLVILLTFPTNKIKSFLDGLIIREDNSVVSSCLPQPGSFIHIEDHHFLMDSFEDFEPGEYVGYELYDPSLHNEEGSPTYVYAIVILEVISECAASFSVKRYRINIGNDKEPVVVDAVDLYKFHRVKGAPCWEFAIYEGASGGSSGAEKPEHHQEVIEEVTRILEEAWRLLKEKRDKIIKRLFLAWHPDKNRENEEFCTKVFQHVKAEISRLERGESRSFGLDYSSYSYHGSYGNFFTRWGGRARSHRTQRSTYFNSGCSSNGYRCNPQPGEASRWFRQAEADLGAVGNDRNDIISSYEWACFKCHQAAEKALKAAQFVRDANNIRIHDLRQNADTLNDATLSSLASSLEGLVGGSTRMRYPDCVSFPRIPHDVYSANKARTAYELAQKILERVKERFVRT